MARNTVILVTTDGRIVASGVTRAWTLQGILRAIDADVPATTYRRTDDALVDRATGRVIGYLVGARRPY